MKANPWNLIQAHYATYVDARDGRPRLRDHFTFEGPPIVAFAASLVIGISLPVYACAGLLTALGLLGAFLFGVMLQIAEKAMEWAEQEPAQRSETSRHAIFLGQIAANAGYAALVSILAATIFVAATLTKGTALTILSALGLAVAAHFVLILLMVMIRVFAEIEDRLLTVRTGATVTPLARQKKAG